MTGTYVLPDGKAVDAGEAAEAAAEAIRALNHILGNPHGMEHAADAYLVLGALASMAHRVPQALMQTQNFLTRELNAGNIGSDAGWAHSRDPHTAVATAALHLGTAHALAAQLGAALEAAQAACSGLHYAGPELPDEDLARYSEGLT